MLPSRASRGLKYFDYFGVPTPREDAETIMVRCYSSMCLDHKLKISDPRRNSSKISSQWTKSSSLVTCKSITSNMQLHETNVWTGSRRGLPASSEPIELLIINKSTTDPAQIPPHPSTLELPNPNKLGRTPRRFINPHVRKKHEIAASVLLSKIVRPLEELGVASETITSGSASLWRGWVRVPKKGESWEPRRERVEGIQSMDGNFRQVNIAYVLSSKSALKM